MNIGQAALETGVSEKMIRYYESIGLMPAVARTRSGYRTYGFSDIHTLRFIKRARSLGFSLEQIEELLNLWKDQSRTSEQVKAVAQSHIDQLKTKIAEMQSILETLDSLANHCQGDDRPYCPILNGLAKR